MQCQCLMGRELCRRPGLSMVCQPVQVACAGRQGHVVFCCVSMTLCTVPGRRPAVSAQIRREEGYCNFMLAWLLALPCTIAATQL